MKKKIVIFIVVVLILVAGGFFWWQEDKIESFLERKKLEGMTAPIKDYNVIEESGEKFIVNEKDGLKIKVPAEWELETGVDMAGMTSERNISLYSQDFTYRPPNGCLIEIEISRLQKRRVEKYNGDLVMYPIEGAEEIKEMIKLYKEAKPKEIEVISIGQKEALKETNILKEGIGKYITVKIPTDNKVYIFKSIQFREECDKEFNKFLETISIR